jgi:hypothetical protein
MQQSQQEGQAPAAAVPVPQAAETVTAVSPPAYSKQPTPTSADAIQQEVNPAPVPAKNLPSDPAQPQKELPMAPNGPQQQAALGVTPLSQLGDHTQWIDCPFCHRRTMTRLRTEGSPMQMYGDILCRDLLFVFVDLSQRRRHCLLSPLRLPGLRSLPGALV